MFGGDKNPHGLPFLLSKLNLVAASWRIVASIGIALRVHAANLSPCVSSERSSKNSSDIPSGLSSLKARLEK